MNNHLLQPAPSLEISHSEGFMAHGAYPPLSAVNRLVGASSEPDTRRFHPRSMNLTTQFSPSPLLLRTSDTVSSRLTPQGARMPTYYSETSRPSGDVTFSPASLLAFTTTRPNPASYHRHSPIHVARMHGTMPEVFAESSIARTELNHTQPSPYNRYYLDGFDLNDPSAFDYDRLTDIHQRVQATTTFGAMTSLTRGIDMPYCVYASSYSSCS